MTNSSRRLIPRAFNGVSWACSLHGPAVTRWGKPEFPHHRRSRHHRPPALFPFSSKSPGSRLLILLGGLCDAIDGSLARNAGKATRFGALLDSSVDRYSEFVMLFGIGGYFLMVDDYVSAP